MIYTLMLFAIPLGFINAFDAHTVDAIADGMNRYLAPLPDELYALFGTRHLGHTAACNWGHVKGVER